MWLLVATMALAALTTSTAQGVQLVPDFYKSRCPRAETLITSAVNTALNKQPRSALGVLRTFFHDCFVNVSDSIHAPLLGTVSEWLTMQAPPTSR